MQALQENTQFGRFRVARLPGEGAQGQVFLAEDPHLERQAAIKTLVWAGDGAATAAGLIEEARTNSRLSHRNIVTLEQLPVIGVTYEQPGTHIARTWNFPQDMLQAMRKLPRDKRPPKAANERDRLCLTANLADELRQVDASAVIEQPPRAPAHRLRRP